MLCMVGVVPLAWADTWMVCVVCVCGAVRGCVHMAARAGVCLAYAEKSWR